jgi:CubicO group peptidase (beta-lactamase class C family)
MKKIVPWSFLLIAFSFVPLFSCKRYASIYQIRKTSLRAADSSYWYDSAFSEEKFLLDTLLEGRSSRGGFNGNVLCAYKGKVFYERSFGCKDIFRKDTMNMDCSFQLASVSKPFTSTAILQLCEEGKISLSDSLEKFFPGFPYKNITVKMLLCHRSGLPNYIYVTDHYYRKQGKYPEVITNDSVINLLYTLKPHAYSPPNAMYDYSNTGFLLLASIVEKVSGEKFIDYLDQHIFSPCGMKNTYVYDMPKKNHRNNSVKAFEDDAEVADHYHNGVVGDKGVYSTAEDLLKFDRALRAGQVLSAQWQDSAYARQNPDWIGPHNYGLGWRLRDGYNGEKIVYHSGWWKGFRTLFVRDMSRDITFIVLDNYRNGNFLFVEDYLWIFNKQKNRDSML